MHTNKESGQVRPILMAPFFMFVCLWAGSSKADCKPTFQFDLSAPSSISSVCVLRWTTYEDGEPRHHKAHAVVIDATQITFQKEVPGNHLVNIVCRRGGVFRTKPCLNP